MKTGVSDLMDHCIESDVRDSRETLLVEIFQRIFEHTNNSLYTPLAGGSGPSAIPQYREHCLSLSLCLPLAI